MTLLYVLGSCRTFQREIVRQQFNCFGSALAKGSFYSAHWLCSVSLHRDGAVVRALASHQCGPGSIPGPGLSLLLVLVPAPRVFLRVLRFSSLHKNQHFQIPIRPGDTGEKSHRVDSTEIPIYFYLLYFISLRSQLTHRFKFYLRK